jgi:hypothetical protein
MSDHLTSVITHTTVDADVAAEIASMINNGCDAGFQSAIIEGSRVIITLKEPWIFKRIRN